MQMQFKFATRWVWVLASLSIAIAGAGIVQAQAPQPEVKTPEAQPQSPQPQVGPPIFSSSSPAAIALAQHLSTINARFFGAWWCKYCSQQKELLGREAMTHIDYVECDLRGLNPKRDLCIASQVPAFPTWEINGNHVTGVQTLEQLADISGYAGDRKF
jgi:glutaredoxin